MGNEQQPAPTGTNQPPPAQAPPPGRAGYLTPEEQARRASQDRQADERFNQGAVNMYKRRQEEDAAANAAAAGGGFVMDAAAMRTFLPQWQSIADRLAKAVELGTQLPNVDKPAEDEGSTLQKQAADAHADAYVSNVTAQQKYAQAYADKLRDSIEVYEKQEQAARDGLRKHGGRQ